MNITTNPLDDLEINIKSNLLVLIEQALPHASQDSLLTALASLDLPQAVAERLQFDIEFMAEELNVEQQVDTFVAEEMAIFNCDVKAELEAVR